MRNFAEGGNGEEVSFARVVRARTCLNFFTLASIIRFHLFRNAHTRARRDTRFYLRKVSRLCHCVHNLALCHDFVYAFLSVARGFFFFFLRARKKERHFFSGLCPTFRRFLRRIDEIARIFEFERGEIAANENIHKNSMEPGTTRTDARWVAW